MKEVFTMEDMRKWMIAVEQAQPSKMMMMMMMMMMN